MAMLLDLQCSSASGSIVMLRMLKAPLKLSPKMRKPSFGIVDATAFVIAMLL